MTKIGYTLSSEETGPLELVGLARRAEQVGFDFASISDHFHPWVDRQGHSPFVWSVLGGIAEATERIPVGTGVTCPIMRMHPAIVAHAAATVATMLPGRFWLGLGAGERLNEHIVGEHWPEPAVRQEMLEEAVEVIRSLWEGRLTSHRGRHFVVEKARLYTLPDEPPPIYIATGGRAATKLAGRIGDGMFGLVPDEEVIETFEKAGGEGKPRLGQIHVCWASSEDDAKRTAREWWPNAALSDGLPWDLPLPSYIEAATANVTEEEIAQQVICGPDPGPYLEAAGEFASAGYSHVYFHQVGPDQEGFLQFAEQELLPELRDREGAGRSEPQAVGLGTQS